MPKPIDSQAGAREFRSLKLGELRTEKSEDGKRYLSGYAATYNTLSSDLGWGIFERILPGAFTRALTEKQDVKHLINHDPNFILGRTTAGTTELAEDSKGLKFRTLINDEDPFATSLFSKVQRGDINECSFAFIPKRTTWVEEPDPGNPDYQRDIRELHDVDLFDVSTVTYPAYPGTKTAAERSGLPSDVPQEIRSRIENGQTRYNEAGDCECSCPDCQDGDCDDCTNADCDDPNCRCMAMRSRRAKDKDNKPKTKRVDGENLASSAFLVVGDEADTKTWKLPWKFSTDEKTRSHSRNALARFNQLKGVSEENKKAAWEALVKLCEAEQIDLSEDSNLRSHLTPDQIFDLNKEYELALAKVRAIKASL